VRLVAEMGPDIWSGSTGLCSAGFCSVDLDSVDGACLAASAGFGLSAASGWPSATSGVLPAEVGNSVFTTPTPTARLTAADAAITACRFVGWRPK
jgi:hypothetical protein